MNGFFYVGDEFDVVLGTGGKQAGEDIGIDVTDLPPGLKFVTKLTPLNDGLGGIGFDARIKGKLTDVGVFTPKVNSGNQKSTARMVVGDPSKFNKNDNMSGTYEVGNKVKLNYSVEREEDNHYSVGDINIQWFRKSKSGELEPIHITGAGGSPVGGLLQRDIAELDSEKMKKKVTYQLEGVISVHEFDQEYVGKVTVAGKEQPAIHLKFTSKLRHWQGRFADEYLVNENIGEVRISATRTKKSPPWGSPNLKFWKVNTETGKETPIGRPAGLKVKVEKMSLSMPMW